MEAFFREAREEDCYELAPNLRPLDLREIQVVAEDETPEEALLRCIAVSEEANAIIIDGACVGLFGVSKLPREMGGAPWLLCSDRLREVPLKLFKQGRRWLKKMLSEHHHLENLCLHEHEESREFIERMGFRFTETIEFNGELFQHFEMDWSN